MKLIPVIAMSLIACGRSGFDDFQRSVDGGDPTGDGANDDADPTGDGSLATTVAFQTLAGMGPPPGRRSSSAALEPAPVERLWMYGGYSGSYLSDLRFCITGTTLWASPTVNGTPPGPRERHSLGWDGTNNVLVMFGGQYRPMITFVHYDELWMWTPVPQTWTQIPKSGTWPPARKDAGLVWVPHLGKFLLYGGNDGPNANNRMGELYTLAINVTTTTATWVQLQPGGVVPPKQSAGCVAYDPAGHRLIVYGGETADGVDNNSTYQYLLDTNVWQLDTTTGTPPPGQSFQQCVWDPSVGRVVLYGGQANGGNPLGGYATYDPDTKTWAAPPASTALLGNRSDGGAVYSPSRDAMLWFGGRSAVTTYINEIDVMDVD